MNFNNLTKQCSNMVVNFGSVQLTSVRYRYWEEKIARGRLIKNFGYRERILTSGPLPRLKTDGIKLPHPDYRPKNSWSDKRAIFGQNDYIDILGDGKLNPAAVSYEVPVWLRGFSGNEMQTMIHKARTFGSGPYADLHPTSLMRINKRIRYLYKYLNRKTKNALD